MESGWNVSVWLVDVVSRRWVWLVGVVVKRYIDFLLLVIPTLVSVLFLQQQPYFLFIFYVFRSCTCISKGDPM